MVDCYCGYEFKPLSFRDLAHYRYGYSRAAFFLLCSLSALARAVLAPHRLGATLLSPYMATSYPMKQHALAGKALSMTGTAPLYMARMPSSRIRWANTSRTPRYFPSGAGRGRRNSSKEVVFCPDTIVNSIPSPVCNLLLSTSGGMATIQLKIPAIPPAKRVRPTPSCVRSPPSGTRARWIISYPPK